MNAVHGQESFVNTTYKSDHASHTIMHTLVYMLASSHIVWCWM